MAHLHMSLTQFVNGALLSFGPCVVLGKASPLYVPAGSRQT